MSGHPPTLPTPTSGGATTARAGHGVAARSSGAALTARELEVLRLVAAGRTDAEIAELLRSGVRVTVNSDDPAYFGGYIVDNYLALAQEAQLTSAEVVTLAENSFAISWLDDARRGAYLDEIRRYVDGFAG